ncbi:MAG: SDR family NAD(P)-dependent oxidoreductase [Actinomycetota bacterium]|nr:SDR family NAD(P)-dependent oxidoreductase [Actinomycetota bacterium]
MTAATMARQGAVAVVTGASRGLGQGIAVALAETGFDVVVGFHRDADGAKATVGAVEACGQRAVAVGGDVADAATADILLAVALADLGGLTAWVNNAGVSVLGPVLDTTAAELARMVDVNLLGTFHGVKAAARAFLDLGTGGRIVNIASEVGLQAFRYLGGYAATKFAVVGLTQAAALELSPAGITVNAVCPGTAETDMVLAERSSEIAYTGLDAESIRASYLDAIPAGRFCAPEDVGAMVAWLAGPGAAYVTGQSLCVNGGSVLR